MIIFVTLIVMIIVLPNIHPKLRGLAVALVTLSLLLVCGFRSYTVGLNDTELVYFPAFKRVVWLADETIWQTYKDPVYYLIMKRFAMIADNYQAWIFVNAALPTVAAGHLIGKYSRGVSLSFLIYLPMLYVFQFYLMRQYAAMFFVLFALDALIEKRYMKSILLIGAGCLFHSICAIFVLAVLVRRFRLKTKHEAVALPLCFLLVNRNVTGVFNFLFGLITEKRFIAYKVAQLAQKDTDTFSYLFIAATVFAVSALILYYNEKDGQGAGDEAREYLYYLKDLSFVAAVLLCFTQVLGETVRLSQFFIASSLLLIPNALAEVRDRRIQIALSAAMGAVFIAYFLMRSLVNTKILPFSFC